MLFSPAFTYPAIPYDGTTPLDSLTFEPPILHPKSWASIHLTLYQKIYDKTSEGPPPKSFFLQFVQEDIHPNGVQLFFDPKWETLPPPDDLSRSMTAREINSESDFWKKWSLPYEGRESAARYWFREMERNKVRMQMMVMMMADESVVPDYYNSLKQRELVDRYIFLRSTNRQIARRYSKGGCREIKSKPHHGVTPLDIVQDARNYVAEIARTKKLMYPGELLRSVEAPPSQTPTPIRTLQQDSVVGRSICMPALGDGSSPNYSSGDGRSEGDSGADEEPMEVDVAQLFAIDVKSFHL